MAASRVRSLCRWQKCEIFSYINNLHPGEHHELYNVIAACFVEVVPLLEATISEIAMPDDEHYG